MAVTYEQLQKWISKLATISSEIERARPSSGKLENASREIDDAIETLAELSEESEDSQQKEDE